MELEVRHLRALCAVADTGSVHKAARQLGMTQPSLTTQLRRIEQAVGGQLFVRRRTGSTPTALGRTVLSRARPIVAEMALLVREARDAAGHTGGEGLRIGSTGSPAVPGWLRRIHDRLPETDTTIHMDVSDNALLRMVAANQLDAAFVHEVEGSPLSVPEGLEMRVLVEREPQFVALPATHPAAAEPVVALAELADARWMVDPTVDGDWPGLRRVFAQAGIEPRVVFGDYLAAAELVASGEVVIACQPTARARPGTAVRPLRGDPLAVRLMLATRAVPASAGARAHEPAAETGPGTRSGARPGAGAGDGPGDGAAPGDRAEDGARARDWADALFADLRDAYAEVAGASDVYRRRFRPGSSEDVLPLAPVVA